MRRMIMAVAGVLAMAGVAQADVADREHLDAQIANLTAQIQALKDVVLSGQADIVEAMPEGGSYECNAPKTFRVFRTTKTGKEKARRFILRAE